MSTFTNQTPNTANFTNQTPTGAVTGSAGIPIGLLLALTYSGTISYPAFTNQTKNNATFTNQTKSA